MAAALAALDRARQLDRAREQQQLFGQRGFTGVRVGNDAEGTATRDFARDLGGRPGGRGGIKGRVVGGLIDILGNVCGFVGHGLAFAALAKLSILPAPARLV